MGRWQDGLKFCHIPAEASETEELSVDQGDHMQGAEDVQLPADKMQKFQMMFQPTSDVQQDTARDLTDGDTICMMCSSPSFGVV